MHWDWKLAGSMCRSLLVVAGRSGIEHNRAKISRILDPSKAAWPVASSWSDGFFVPAKAETRPP